MTKARNLLWRIFKPRKQQRYLVENGTLVVVVTPGRHGQEQRRQVHVIDISMGGAAFIYEGSPEELEDTGFLQITASTPNKEKVYFETVSDHPVPDLDASQPPYRRRGVKFTWMGALGESYLKEFIQDKGICRL